MKYEFATVMFQKLPKVNKQLAEKLLDNPEKEPVRHFVSLVIKS